MNTLRHMTMRRPAVLVAQESILRLNATAIDYLIIALYFTFVLGIGYLAKRAVSTSLDFFLSGRSLPAWVTGLAFISANLGGEQRRHQPAGARAPASSVPERPLWSTSCSVW